MKQYKYEALNAANEHVEGICNAENFEAAIFKILQANLYPTRIDELTNYNRAIYGRMEKMRKILGISRPQIKLPKHKGSIISKREWSVAWLLWAGAIVAGLLILWMK